MKSIYIIQRWCTYFRKWKKPYKTFRNCKRGSIVSFYHLNKIFSQVKNNNHFVSYKSYESYVLIWPQLYNIFLETDIKFIHQIRSKVCQCTWNTHVVEELVLGFQHLNSRSSRHQKMIWLIIWVFHTAFLMIYLRQITSGIFLAHSATSFRMAATRSGFAKVTYPSLILVIYSMEKTITYLWPSIQKYKEKKWTICIFSN